MDEHKTLKVINEIGLDTIEFGDGMTTLEIAKERNISLDRARELVTLAIDEGLLEVVKRKQWTNAKVWTTVRCFAPTEKTKKLTGKT